MNTTALILEFLKKNDSVEVPGFGIFSLKNSRAKIDSETNSILPPVKEIDFAVDYEAQNGALVNYFATQKNISAVEASNQLKSETDYWKKTLVENGELNLDNLGQIHQTENGIAFKGSRIEKSSPDFYGLEEINLSNLKKSSTGNVSKDSDYQFNKSILWLFLLIIPVAGIVFLAFTQSEKLFGKKSFTDTPVKSSTRRIEPDSSKIKAAIADSLKLDSIKQDSVKKSTVVPAKKWSNKTYKKKTWRKAKKRVNR